MLNSRRKNKESILRFISKYIVFSLLSLFSLFLFGSTNLYSYSIDSQKLLSSRISFWEDVFYKYPSSSILIHDTRYPELILDIIDYKKLSKMNGRNYNKYEKNLILQKYFWKMNCNSGLPCTRRCHRLQALPYARFSSS